MSYFYYIEPLYGEIEVELEYDVYYDYCPGDYSTPEYEECWIESIKHRGKEVSTEALERLFSMHHGCHMSWEKIEEIVLEDWTEHMVKEGEAEAEDMKAEGLI